MIDWFTRLYCRGVDIKFLEDGKCFLIELTADGDVGDVGGVVVIQARDVVHHTSVVSFDCSQNQQILKVPASNEITLSQMRLV